MKEVTDMAKTTIKVTVKDGETIIENSNGVEFRTSGSGMRTDTAIASMVFQTIYMGYLKLESFSDEFEIEFTMKDSIMDKDV